MEFNLLDRLKTLCARARSMFLRFIRPISRNYKSDLSDLVQTDSIDFSIFRVFPCTVYFKSRAYTSAHESCEVNFFCKIELWDTSYDHIWDWKLTRSGPEVDWKWNARDVQALGACSL